jgi:hypothetical protein
VSDELVAQVLTGEVSASVSAIRRERAGGRSEERSFALGDRFIDHLDRFKGTSEDFAAGVAAQVLRAWKEPEDRAWFARCMCSAAEMIEADQDRKIPLLELPRTTVRRLREGGAG